MSMEEEKKIEEEIELTFTPAEEELPEAPVAEEPAEENIEEQEDKQPVSGVESTKQSIEQLKKFTEEDEDLYSATKTLRSILGGDFLTARFVRKQLPVVILIFACFFLHISFRYTNQKELVEIDKLKKQLEDAQFNALTRFSELTAKSRQSYIEQFLKQHNDSTLQTATNPPYIIHLRGDEGDFTSPEEKVKDEGKEKTPAQAEVMQEEIIED